MQVDIGNNTVLQNFSSIVSSAEIRQLNDRLQQAYAGAAPAQATAAGHQEGGEPGTVLSQRRVYHNAVEGAAGAPSSHPNVSRLRRRSSLNLSRSSAGSRHSYHHYQGRQHGSTPRSRSGHSQSPEQPALWPQQATLGVSHIAAVTRITTPANSSTAVNNASVPSRANISGIPRILNSHVVQPPHLQQLLAPPQQTPAAFGGIGPSPAPMATVTSTPHRQQGWPDAAQDKGGAASPAGAVDGAPVCAGDNRSKGMFGKEGDGNCRRDEGSGPHGGGDARSRNCNDKPAAAASPKLAHTKIQVGMRLRRWIIINRIGAGSFGETFTAMEVDGPAEEEDSLTVASENMKLLENLPPVEERNEVCIKVEQENKNVLRLEALALKKVQPCPQVVRYLGSGCTNGMNYLVMEKLGSNLAELRRRSQHGTFNIYTTLKAGVSCLTAIRGVHDLGLVHRDIKPSNFVTGLPGTPDHTTCYLIDFGLARRFRRSNGEIRPPRENAGFRGTSRYASVASHHHQELGRVDDLWSLLFMLVEFATGTLPWRKYKEKDDIGRCKEESISPHLVRNLPREFQPFLAHLQTLRYEDEPDYDLLLTLMHRALERRGYPPNKPVEWEIDSSLADSCIDADGAPVVNAGAGAVQGSAAHLRDVGPAPDAAGNGHSIDGNASGRPLQPPPRRAAPLPGAVEMGSRELLHMPLHPDAAQPNSAASRVGSGNGAAGNGATASGYPADALHPHNSGTLRVSEVDIGGSGACQDSMHGNPPVGVDVSVQNRGPRPQGDSVDIPLTTACLAAEGSESPRAQASSGEYDHNEYSLRENGSGAYSPPMAPVSYFNAAVASGADPPGSSPAAGSLANSALEPNNATHWRETAAERNGLKRRSGQQQRENECDIPDITKRGAGRWHQHMVGPTADLDASVAADEQGEAHYGKDGKASSKKKLQCECVVM
ncbi:protein kinase, putative [Leishmania donovani]|uniref:non-specific serine/threonine protein kinase n=1 Tax=Leishmania donovani TaxID=5661 RepID=E9BR83_LEIDO|nr:protein kinase, putative [Leishmania donovani]TPP40188.1 Protein kinase domain family protein [Leishmania donovani]CBZ37762.1 protein kinase, putative [Leishmania donovani]